MYLQHVMLHATSRRSDLQVAAELQLPLSWLEQQRRQEAATCGDVVDAPFIL